jgi:hypothetical protein
VTLRSFADLVGKTCNRKQGLTFQVCSATSFVNHNLVWLTNILHRCSQDFYKMRPVLSPRARPRSWFPIPRHPTEVGAVIIYVDFGPRKLVCDQELFLSYRGSLTSFTLSLLAMAYSPNAANIANGKWKMRAKQSNVPFTKLGRCVRGTILCSLD